MSSLPVFRILAGVSLGLVALGCRTATVSGNASNPDEAREWIRHQQVYREGVRDRLPLLRAKTESLVDECFEAISASGLPSETLREIEALKRRYLSGVRITFEDQDPLVSLVDVWGFNLQALQFAQGSMGAETFGARQALVVDTLGKIDQAVRAIPRSMMPPEQYAQLEGHLDRFAKEHPIQKGFVGLGEIFVGSTKEAAGVILSVFKAPAAPATKADAILKIADQVGGVSKQVDEVHQIFKTMPSVIRAEATTLTRTIHAESDALADSIHAKLSDLVDRIFIRTLVILMAACLGGWLVASRWRSGRRRSDQGCRFPWPVAPAVTRRSPTCATTS